jgi:threonine aldolase
MRFHAAGWVGMLENGVWLKYAKHANQCAAKLAKRLEIEAKLIPAHAVEANAVFVAMPKNLIQYLRDQGWVIYSFIGSGVVRLMCSWRTSEADIDSLLTDVLAFRSKDKLVAA